MVTYNFTFQWSLGIERVRHHVKFGLSNNGYLPVTMVTSKLLSSFDNYVCEMSADYFDVFKCCMTESHMTTSHMMHAHEQTCSISPSDWTIISIISQT